MRGSYQEGSALADALGVAVKALQSAPRTRPGEQQQRAGRRRGCSGSERWRWRCSTGRGCRAGRSGGSSARRCVGCCRRRTAAPRTRTRRPAATTPRPRAAPSTTSSAPTRGSGAVRDRARQIPARWVQRPPSSVPATGMVRSGRGGHRRRVEVGDAQVGAPAHRDRAVRAGRRGQRDRQRDLLLGMPRRAVVAAAVHGGRDRDPRVERGDRRVGAQHEPRAGVEQAAVGERAAACARPRAGRRRRGRRARARAARWPPRRARRTGPGRRRAAAGRARCDRAATGARAKASSTSSFARSPIACTAASIPCAAARRSSGTSSSGGTSSIPHGWAVPARPG